MRKLNLTLNMRAHSNRSDPTLIQKHDAPSLKQVLGIVLVAYSVFFIVLRLAAGSLSLVGSTRFGDNPSYLEAAAAIRHWQFAGVLVKQFWGLPYAVAGLCAVTGISERAGMVVVCILSSLVSVALCYRLWGGWVAVFFALLSLDWFQRSLLGGAEPLFMLMIFASFLALRQAKWAWSAVFGGLATVVRPFGIFALAGLGVQLLWQKKFRQCAIAVAIALSIGCAYAWPLAHYLGGAFANVSMYQKSDWHGGLPFNWPFLAIIHDTIPINAPLTDLVLTLGWIAFVLLGLVVAVGTGDFITYAKKYPAEICFVSLYCLALYTYDAPGWSRSNFPRFALPMLPWTLVFLRRLLPAHRWVVGALAVISPALAAASAIGIRNVWGLVHSHLR